MLNLFLLECAQMAPDVRTHHTQQLQRALSEGTTEQALMALAWGADPHAASLDGELLMGRALECHHPRLVGAFLAVGGQYQLVRPEPLGAFWLRAANGVARSRIYDPKDRKAAGVLATFADFQAIAWRMRAAHARVLAHRPSPNMQARALEPNFRWHALLGILDLMRKELYVPGSGFGISDSPAEDTGEAYLADVALVPVLRGIQ